MSVFWVRCTSCAEWHAVKSETAAVQMALNGHRCNHTTQART